jgi:transcription antitermination factor NusG
MPWSKDYDWVVWQADYTDETKTIIKNVRVNDGTIHSAENPVLSREELIALVKSQRVGLLVYWTPSKRADEPAPKLEVVNFRESEFIRIYATPFSPQDDLDELPAIEI